MLKKRQLASSCANILGKIYQETFQSVQLQFSERSEVKLANGQFVYNYCESVKTNLVNALTLISLHLPPQRPSTRPEKSRERISGFLSYGKAEAISSDYVFLSKDDKNVFVEVTDSTAFGRLKSILKTNKLLIVTPVKEAKIKLALQNQDFDPSTLIQSFQKEILQVNQLVPEK